MLNQIHLAEKSAQEGQCEWILDVKPVKPAGSKALLRKLVSCVKHRGCRFKAALCTLTLSSLSRQSEIVCTQHPTVGYRWSWRGRRCGGVGGAGALKWSSRGWRVKGRRWASETCLHLQLSAVTLWCNVCVLSWSALCFMFFNPLEGFSKRNWLGEEYRLLNKHQNNRWCSSPALFRTSYSNMPSVLPLIQHRHTSCSFINQQYYAFIQCYPGITNGNSNT